MYYLAVIVILMFTMLFLFSTFNLVKSLNLALATLFFMAVFGLMNLNMQIVFIAWLVGFYSGVETFHRVLVVLHSDNKAKEQSAKEQVGADMA